MSARSALTVVGAAVGSYFGYPQLGAMIGPCIGSTYYSPTRSPPHDLLTADEVVSTEEDHKQ